MEQVRSCMRGSGAGCGVLACEVLLAIIVHTILYVMPYKVLCINNARDHGRMLERLSTRLRIPIIHTRKPLPTSKRPLTPVAPPSASIPYQISSQEINLTNELIATRATIASCGMPSPPRPPLRRPLCPPGSRDMTTCPPIDLSCRPEALNTPTTWPLPPSLLS